MADSQRKTERVPYNQPVKIRKPSPMDGKCVDLAAGGMGVEVAQPIPEGSGIEVELFGGGAVVQGTVRKVLPGSGGSHRLGIQFTKEDPTLVARAQG
jgi:hypothetical protein